MTLLKTHKDFFFLWGWCFLCFILEISPYIEVKKIAFCIKFSIKNKLHTTVNTITKYKLSDIGFVKVFFPKGSGSKSFYMSVPGELLSVLTPVMGESAFIPMWDVTSIYPGSISVNL